jgi:hypothetical protein
MDKIQEVLIAMAVSVIGIFSFMAKRIFSTVDSQNKRIDKLERKIIDQQFLESQIAPIRSDLNIILKHLLANKND